MGEQHEETRWNIDNGAVLHIKRKSLCAVYIVSIYVLFCVVPITLSYSIIKVGCRLLSHYAARFWLSALGTVVYKDNKLLLWSNYVILRLKLKYKSIIQHRKESWRQTVSCTRKLLKSIRQLPIQVHISSLVSTLLQKLRKYIFD